MKIMDKIRIGILAITLIFVMQSCLKDDFNEVHEQLKEKIPQTYGNFDFTTIKEFDITLNAITANQEAISGAYIEIYAEHPLNNDGILKKGIKTEILFKGATNAYGALDCNIAPRINMDSIYILSYHAGIPPLQKAALDNDKININLISSNKNQSNTGLKNAVATPNIVNGYYVLGNWNSVGVPDYLELVNDIISSAFLDDVNASLPERTPLPESHPQYLANTADGSINIIDNCEIWVTLVHEGAGWHNTLGYYTYPTNNPPNNINDISDRTIIFPDVTINSNTLSSGNKVQLQYFDANSNEFTNIFPAGTSVGWFLIAQGWNSSQQSVGNGIYTHYSNVNLNNEEDPLLQKHNVLLYDEARELLLLGFEDIRRDQTGCDQDFNDAIFYATMNPITAVDLSIYQPIDQPIDNDNDGVSNVFDQYPDNAQKAFDNYYPGNSTFGTLLFEDLWPYRGDYDFNDLVVDYQFNQTTNSQNQVTNISTRLVVKAIGASYHNGFGIEFNTLPTNVASVSGQELSKNIINLSGNGTESGQANAVVIMFDDAYNALPYPGTGIGVNTYPQYPYVTPDTLNVEVSFVNPIPFNQIGTPPHNPFIFIEGNREVEVHLPNSPPTSLVNRELLGTGDDNSNPNQNRYYVSDQYLPWAINLPVSFDYPIEKHDITETHLMFNPWALSNGFNHMDWYRDLPGYRNINNIYRKQ